MPKIWDQQRLTNLRRILAPLFLRFEDQTKLLFDVELDPTEVWLQGTADTIWFSILDYANKQLRVDDVVGYARKRYPKNELLLRAHEEHPPGPIVAPDIGAWLAPDLDRDTREKITGTRSTLVPIAYLAKGLRRARAVARVRLADGSSGSGFLAEDGLFITNHHVLPSANVASSAVAQFNYEQSVEGLDEAYEDVRFDPARFYTSEEDDWTAVGVEGHPEEKWGCLPFESTMVDVGTPVNIIQHPGGGPKQVSFYSNIVVHVSDGRLQYLTDTLSGSSGSPVFDLEWKLVALHHRGGWLPEPGSREKEIFLRNQGIAIDVVRTGITARARASA